MARSLKGRIVGLLVGTLLIQVAQSIDIAQGYGALGRETARLLKSFGMTIIAANTSARLPPKTA